MTCLLIFEVLGCEVNSLEDGDVSWYRVDYLL